MNDKLTESIAIDLDFFLKEIVESGATCGIDTMESLIPNKDDGYYLVMFDFLSKEELGLLDPKSEVVPNFFFASQKAKHFLNEGGFRKIFQQEKIAIDRKEKKERYDLRNSKYSLPISIVAIIISIFSLCLTLWKIFESHQQKH